MKPLKMLELVVVVAGVFMAGASSASATTLTSPAGSIYTGTITATAGTTELHSGDKSFPTVVCHSSEAQGKVETHGVGAPAKGSLTTLDFGICTNGTVTVLQKGSLAITAVGGGNGTLTSSGAEIRIHTSSGPVCTFKTSSTHIGTLTGSSTTGGKATLHIGSSLIPASGFLCPGVGIWTGDYTVASPSFLDVSETVGSTLTSPAGSTYTNTIIATAGKTELHAGDSKSFLTVACHSSEVQGKVERHGAGVAAGGEISTLDFGTCTNGIVTVLKKGALEVHGSGEGNGTVTSTGAEIRIHTSSGPVCTFKTSSTHIGTLTGSSTTGGKATLHIGSAVIPATGFLCPATGIWTGDYTVASPSFLDVD
jgi:hypothetical protein